MNIWIRNLLFTWSIIFPSFSYAYIGPGTGLSAIGSLVAFVGAILLLIVGFVWFPIKRMLGLKTKQTTPQAETNIETQTEQAIDSDPEKQDAQ